MTGDVRTPRRRELRTQRARDAVEPGLTVAAGGDVYRLPAMSHRL